MVIPIKYKANWPKIQPMNTPTTASNFDSFKDLPLHRPRPAGAPTALQGIRVVDFTHFIAGPFATTIMAEMGAEVIKVETPGRGDEFRYYPPVHPQMPAQGAPHMWTNRNKRSVAINLKTPEGLAVVRELIKSADVVAENFSTGVMERFGLDYAAVKKINPKIIYLSVSAYGREGEFADRLGFDPIAQAESGFISMNGYNDRQGVRTLSPVVDISTAMMACNAVLGALIARGRTGEGQLIEVALFDNALLMTGYASMQHLFSGAEGQRHGNTSPDTCPSGVFESKDKPFYINCGNDKIFLRLATQTPCCPTGTGASPGVPSCSSCSRAYSGSSPGNTGSRECVQPRSPAAKFALSGQPCAPRKRPRGVWSPASLTPWWAGCRTSRCRFAFRARRWSTRNLHQRSASTPTKSWPKYWAMAQRGWLNCAPAAR
jgi:crotonobetainyl-CoA:carnitine CoA-transferase CaiB-like acyl-CoA transferase